MTEAYPQRFCAAFAMAFDNAIVAEKGRRFMGMVGGAVVSHAIALLWRASVMVISGL